MPSACRPPAPAANAYLKRELGPAASARLTGVKDMPKGASRLSLDFSSLLGPLFSMWLLQVCTCGRFDGVGGVCGWQARTALGRPAQIGWPGAKSRAPQRLHVDQCVRELASGAVKHL